MSRRLITTSTSQIVLLISLIGLAFVISNSFAADFEIQRWRAIEIELSSTHPYNDPFYDVDVTAFFSGSDGNKISRPAFWDGGLTWKIRFSPPETGLWMMTTAATDTSNSGLHQVTRTIECRAYSGDLAIYQHGFLKISACGRYLTYADCTPFFYLGDTHWILPHERFEISNAPEVASQFKYTVDKRVQQGFTVYQSEPIWQPHGGGTHDGADEELVADLRDGFTSADSAGFANLDRKFKYIADQGLVHANAQVDWATNPVYFPVFTETYMARLARYWVARYGAYPVIWTIAQEIDKNMYGAYTAETITKWFAVGQGILENDDYHHPIMPHSENTHSTTWENSWWCDKPYHHGWAIQWQGEMTDMKIAKGFWNSSPTKPLVLYEGQYDQFWTDARGALAQAYKAFQYGIYGYGYGVNGVWNDIYSKPDDPPDYGTGYQMPERYFWWFDGANLETGDQLTHFKNLYTSLEWWKLTPRFDDRNWGAFFDPARSLLSSDKQKTFVVFFFSDSKLTGTLKNLDTSAVYLAKWFNPRDGHYTLIDTLRQGSAAWLIPQRPTQADWILLVKKIPSDPAGIDNSKRCELPDEFILTQNSPNPFNSETIIRYRLPNPAAARIAIYNSRGELIKVLVDTNHLAGNHTVRWDGRDERKQSVASGIYFCVLKLKSAMQSRKLVLIR
ncbi:DUF4038 domain-containing protein [candidate division KSB1 bacterium]|nr:DUF4038 domain-containing protein [candidate division KSB1 bacterium]